WTGAPAQKKRIGRGLQSPIQLLQPLFILTLQTHQENCITEIIALSNICGFYSLMSGVIVPEEFPLLIHPHSKPELTQIINRISSASSQGGCQQSDNPAFCWFSACAPRLKSGVAAPRLH